MSAPVDPPTRPPEQIQPSAADYMRLFNLSLDLLCIAGLDGYFRKVNPAWTKVMGWSEEELLAQPVAYFMHPDDRERTLAARANLAKGVLVRGLENRYLCKDGSYRWLAWQSSVEIADGTVFAVARDITEKRQHDHENLILGKLESTGVLVDGLAHDFNNLLGGLLLNLDMIGLTGPLQDGQAEHLRRSQEAVRAAVLLTQQLQTFAHGGEVARKVCEVEPLVRQAVELALGGSRIRIVYDFQPGLWPINVDEAQVSQTIRNVALNAREAMPKGGTVRVTASNQPATLDREGGLVSPDSVRIGISDEGGGIPPEIATKIFDPYFSTKPRGTQKGMGLGLTIGRTVVYQHGGTMKVDSTPGTGTTLTITLPAARIPIAPPTAAPLVPAGGLPVTRKILVMDDEPVFRQIVGEAIRRYGYHVELAADGDEVIALCESARSAGGQFDAVLLDLTVRGGKGGAETMRQLRASNPAIKGVLMTGYSSDQTFRDYTQHGFDAALGKPFSADALHAALCQVFTTGAGTA